MTSEAKDKTAGAVEAPPYTPGAVVLDVFGEEDKPPGGWDAPTGGVYALPPAHERLRGFLDITAVQQTLVLFLGSLAYDAGSIAYLIDLLPASIFFLLASGLFVVGLALDIRQLKEQQAEARASDPEVADELLRNMWRRYLALVINLAGGAVSLIASVDYLRVSQEITTYEGNEAALRTGDIEFAVGIWLFSLGTAFLVYDMRATVLAICKLQGRPPPPWKEDKTLQVLVLYSASLVLFGIASTLYILPGDTSQTIGVALFVVSNVSVTSINLIGLWYLWKAHCEEWEVQWLHDVTLAAVDAMEAAHHERSMHGGVAGHGGRETEEDPVELVEERRPPRNSSGTHPPPQRSSSATSELQHQQQPHRDDMAVPAAASESGGDDADDGPPSVRSSLGDDTSHSGTGRARYRVSLSMNRVSTPRASLAHIDETPVVSEGTRHALASAGLLPSARLSKARMSTRMARQQSFDRSSAGSPRAAGSSEGGTPPLSVRSSADLDVQQQRSSGDRLPPSSSLREFGVGRRLSQVQDSSGEDADAPVSSRTTDTV